MGETESSMYTKIQLEIDPTKRSHKIALAINNIDIMLSPIQIYTISQALNYMSYLMKSNTHNVPGPIDIHKEIHESPKMPQPQLDQQIAATFELFRLSVRVLVDDTADLKRFYYSYTPDEVSQESQIQAIKWKTPYSFFEFLLVYTKVEIKADIVQSKLNLVAKGANKYVLFALNTLQSFALKKSGVLLDDSISTIYASAHRTFSVPPTDIPNLLNEDISVTQHRYHFCFHKIFEIRSPSLKLIPTSPAEEGEIEIDIHLPPTSGPNVNASAIEFTFELTQEDGKITGSHQMSIYEKDIKLMENTNVLNYIYLSLSLSPIRIDFSPEIPLFLDHVFKPTGGMLFVQSQQYAQIFSLYSLTLVDNPAKEAVENAVGINILPPVDSAPRINQ